MKEKEKETAIYSSVTADNQQSLNSKTTDSISNSFDDFNLHDYENYLHTVSLTELYDTAYQPKTQIIENLLSAGTYIFAGAPKVGKSFFMAQLGFHVSTGMNLWGYKVHQGEVLYLALEDDYARLQKRLSKMFDLECADGFHFATHAKNMKEGLDGQLRKFVTEHSDTKLIIIDTLQKVREVGGEKYSYASDYDTLAQLKKLSDEKNVCILLIHHTRKQMAEDSFDTISGTNGLLGAADGAFIMQKEKRTENKAVLDIVGRDQQDQRLYLSFERERCVWEFVKQETELWKEEPDPILEVIATFLSGDNIEWIGTATELLTHMRETELQANVLTRKLNVNVDILWNEYGISLETKRTHSGRKIHLIKNKRDDNDGRDGILESGVDV